ncbi:hypothetical protein ADK41_14575 [Streptomyces caelestis]|uniref:Uncharacterized protein n=1 Tax=Streptomyces caelestis TaxID=36816 RepID=A0A0M8QSG7_9ACTN|nr:hypothetical protein ADK41_14575 [Streptomyces caelestis]
MPRPGLRPELPLPRPHAFVVLAEEPRSGRAAARVAVSRARVAVARRRNAPNPPVVNPPATAGHRRPRGA